jgi:hypothetical protein
MNTLACLQLPLDHQIRELFVRAQLASDLFVKTFHVSGVICVSSWWFYLSPRALNGGFSSLTIDLASFCSVKGEHATGN